MTEKMILTAGLVLATVAGTGVAQSFDSDTTGAEASFSADTNITAGLFGLIELELDDLDIPTTTANGSGASNVVFTGSELGFNALDLDFDDLTVTDISDSDSDSFFGVGASVSVALNEFSLSNARLSLASPTSLGTINPDGTVTLTNVDFAFFGDIFVDAAFDVEADGIDPISETINETFSLMGQPFTLPELTLDTFFDEPTRELTVSSDISFDEGDVNDILGDAFGVTFPLDLADIESILGPLDLPVTPDLEIALNSLNLSASFESTFSNVPAPSGLLALAGAGLVAGRRRRG